MKKTIRDIKEGDLVMGTDGKWHKVIEKTNIKLSYGMYKVTFSNGSVKCSNTHQWNIYVNDKMYTIDTEGLYQEYEFYKGKHIGTLNGPTFESIEKIPPELVQCITTDAPDHQFAIYVQGKDDKNEE